MAIVDVSKIPNNSKFDPVREAILELEGNILSGVAGVSSLNGQTGNVNIVAGDNITVSANNGAIVISSTATGGGGGTLDNPLTLTAGNGILLSSPSIFDGSSALEITISHSDTSDITNEVNIGGVVIQGLTFDDYGHVQTAQTTDLDARYLAFRTIRTNNDNNETTATSYNDVVEFEGLGAISVTKSPTTNEIRFGLSLSDVRYQDGKRVARGFLYYQGGASVAVWDTTSSTWSTNNNFWGLQEPTVGDLPTGSTYDFTSNTINVNDSNWAETPPTAGYAFTTYYVVRYTSVDEGGTGEDARPVTYGDVTDAVGFEGPVTFNSLSEELGANGLTVIDGGRIQTGIITSNGVKRVGIDAGTSFFTEQGSYFELASGDIATPEFSVLDGNARFKGDVLIGQGTGQVPSEIRGDGTINLANGVFVIDASGNLTISNDATITELDALTTTVNGNTTQITANASSISQNSSDISIANGNISVNASNITSLQSQLTTANGNISANATNIQINTTNITANANGVAANASSISSLTATVNNNTASITTNASAIAEANGYTEANYALTANANGVITGIQLKAADSSLPTGQVSDITMKTNTFNIVDQNDNVKLNLNASGDLSVVGSLSAGLVNVTNNVISVGASSNYTSKGTIRFNDDTGTQRASISTQLTTIGPLTVAELLIDSSFKTTVQSGSIVSLSAPNIIIDASSSLSFGSQYDRVSDYTGGVATTEQNHSIQLAGGAIIKWGYQSNSAVTHFVPFPTAFPTNCSSVSITTNRSSQSSNGANYAYSVSRTGFVAVLDADYDFWWIAIGF